MKKLFTLAALAALCAATAKAADAPAAAEQAPAAAKQEVKTPAAAPVEITTTTVMEKLSGWDTKLETLKLSFKQDISFGDTGIASKIVGTVAYQKPNKLRIEHTAPQRQVVYTDKRIIWIYKPQDAQVVKARWEDWLQQQSGAFAGITDFGGYTKLLDTHTLKVSEQEKAGTVTATFTPKKDPKAYELKLVLSREDFFPVAIWLKIDSTIVDTKLEKIEKNVKIPEAELEFTPPQGVTVLELTGNK